MIMKFANMVKVGLSGFVLKLILEMKVIGYKRLTKINSLSKWIMLVICMTSLITANGRVYEAVAS